MKVWDCGDGTNFRQSYKKLTRRQDEAATLKAYRISLVYLFFNIHILTWYYKKGKAICLQFFQLQYYQMLLKWVNV